MIRIEKTEPVRDMAHALEINIERDFVYYIPEIVPIIQRIIDRGDYPYNSDVEKECRKDKFFDVLSDRQLSHFVYTSQRKHENMETERNIEEYLKQADEQGYIEPTPEIIQAIVRKKQFVTVQAWRKEPFRAKPSIATDGTLFWMPPKHTRKGFTGMDLVRIKF